MEQCLAVTPPTRVTSLSQTNLPTSPLVAKGYQCSFDALFVNHFDEYRMAFIWKVNYKKFEVCKVEDLSAYYYTKIKSNEHTKRKFIKKDTK